MARSRPAEHSDPDGIRHELDAIGDLRDQVEQREQKAVSKARAAGISWQEIATRLRRATSSVFERYRDVEGPPSED